MRYNEEYYQTGTWWWNNRFQAIVKLVYVRNQCDIEIHTKRGIWSTESVWYDNMPTEMYRIKNFDQSMLPATYQYPEQVVQARAEAERERKKKAEQERKIRYQESLRILESVRKKNH